MKYISFNNLTWKSSEEVTTSPVTTTEYWNAAPHPQLAHLPQLPHPLNTKVVTATVQNTVKKLPTTQTTKIGTYQHPNLYPRPLLRPNLKLQSQSPTFINHSISSSRFNWRIYRISTDNTNASLLIDSQFRLSDWHAFCFFFHFFFSSISLSLFLCLVMSCVLCYSSVFFCCWLFSVCLNFAFCLYTTKQIYFPSSFSSNWFITCSSGAGEHDAKISNKIGRSANCKDNRPKK